MSAPFLEKIIVPRFTRLVALGLCLPALVGCPFVVVPTYSVEKLPFDFGYSVAEPDNFNDRSEVLAWSLGGPHGFERSIWQDGVITPVPEIENLHLLTAILTDHSGVLANYETSSRIEPYSIVMNQWIFGFTRTISPPAGLDAKGRILLLNANGRGDYLGVILPPLSVSFLDFQDSEVLTYSGYFEDVPPEIIVWNDAGFLWGPEPLPAPLNQSTEFGYEFGFFVEGYINNERRVILHADMNNGQFGPDVLVTSASGVEYLFDEREFSSLVGGLNDRGAAVGYSIGRPYFARLEPWIEDEGIVTLPFAYSNGQAYSPPDINDFGTAVGVEVARRSGVFTPTLWRKNRGSNAYEAFDIKKLVMTPLPEDVLIINAEINNFGEILLTLASYGEGSGYYLLRPEGFKLVDPVEAPGETKEVGTGGESESQLERIEQWIDARRIRVGETDTPLP